MVSSEWSRGPRRACSVEPCLCTREDEKWKPRPHRAGLGGTHDSPARITCSTDARSAGGFLSDSSGLVQSQFTNRGKPGGVWGLTLESRLEAVFGSRLKPGLQRGAPSEKFFCS